MQGSGWPVWRSDHATFRGQISSLTNDRGICIDVFRAAALFHLVSGDCGAVAGPAVEAAAGAVVVLRAQKRSDAGQWVVNIALPV